MTRKNVLIASILVTGLAVVLFSPSKLFADLKDKNAKVYFANGDKISGKIISEENDFITIANDSLGEVRVKKALVSKIVTEGEKKAAEAVTIEESKLWKKELGVGYSQSTGNTRKSNASVDFAANKKTDKDETNIKANSSYSSANKKMDGQKWYGMGRYALNLWDSVKWFNFYKLEIDHDRFANINYRVIPSVGLGYWFSDTADWKAMTEAGFGSGYVNYRDDTKNTNEAIIISRSFFDKRLFKESHLSEDFTIYPSLKNSGEYRLHSETAFTNLVTEQLFLKISLIDDYNSDSAKDKKKNDTQIISSLNYSF